MTDRTDGAGTGSAAAGTSTPDAPTAQLDPLTTRPSDPQNTKPNSPAAQAAKSDSPAAQAAKPDSIVAWAWYVDGRAVQCPDLQQASAAALAGRGFVWLGLHDPSDDDMAEFASQFNLHPLAIEDAVHGHTRSKLEQFGDTLFLVVSTVAYVDHDQMTATSQIVTTGQVMVFLGERFVMTVRRGKQAELGTIRAQLEAEPDRLAHGPTTVLYGVLDRIIDDYQSVVAAMEDDLDDVEAAVFSPVDCDVAAVYQLKRELIAFKKATLPLEVPLLALSNRSYGPVPAAAQAYFRELADHFAQAREAITSMDEVLNSILQFAQAQLSFKDNQDMRKISAWVAIVAVPTMIAGIYGMNFENMPELRTKYGYFVVLGVMAVIMVSLAVGFRRNKWL